MDFLIWGIPWYKALVFLFGDNLIFLIIGIFWGRLWGKRRNVGTEFPVVNTWMKKHVDKDDDGVVDKE